MSKHDGSPHRPSYPKKWHSELKDPLYLPCFFSSASSFSTHDTMNFSVSICDTFTFPCESRSSVSWFFSVCGRYSNSARDASLRCAAMSACSVWPAAITSFSSPISAPISGMNSIRPSGSRITP